MGNHNTTIWDKQPHTRAKHEILRRYLDAWLPIMSRYNERLLILDGFAGPGEYTDGSDGSPLIAVNALIQHPHIEQMRVRVPLQRRRPEAARQPQPAPFLEGLSISHQDPH